MVRHTGKFVSTVPALVLAVGLASPALAQEAERTGAGDAGDGFGEIVVTAQRRAESLQEVPISATVLTGAMLEAKGVDGIQSLQYAAPGLTMADYGSANVLNIRGIGRSAVDIELPSGVVLYRDSVPTFPGYFQNEPYFDIAGVEVLKGPQGTVAGKSAAGGAIFIRTASPDLSGFSGKAQVEYGNYQQYGGTLVLNAPLSDTFGVRLAYRHFQRDKILGKSLTGDFTGRPGRPNQDSVRLGALWEPDTAFSAELRLDLSDLDFGGNLTSSYGADLYDYVQNANFAYRDKSARLVGKMSYTLDSGVELRSVSGYQGVHTINNFDRNGAAPSNDRFDSAGTFKLYSQELNLISPDDDDHPFSYILGAFYQRTDTVIEDVENDGFNFYGEPGDLGGFVQSSEFPYLGLATPYRKREKDLSAFVDLKYKFDPRFYAELGLRYSNYKTRNQTDIVFGDGTADPTIPFFAGTQSLSESDVDGKFTLSFNPNRDHNIYANVARAHISGGFNIVGGAKFDKERVWNYELGWKANWAGRKVQTQFAAFYQTLSNYQAQFANPDLGGQNLLQNADGQSKIYGAEFALQARLGGFHFDASVAYLDSKLGDFPNVVSPFLPPPNNVISISGGKSPFAPKFAFNGGARYEFLVSEDTTITPRVDVSSQSKQLGALFDVPETRLPSRTLINAGLMVQKGPFSVDFWVENLADKRFVAGIQDLGRIWYPAAPRQYGVKLGFEF